MTISTRKRFRSLTAACALCVAGLLVQGVVYGAGTVPSIWNVSPLTNGASRESFDSSSAWMKTNELLSSLAPTNSHVDGYLARQTTWFPLTSVTNALSLSTGSAMITNTLDGGNSYESQAVYADMRVKFQALTSPPLDIGDAKCAVFAYDNSTLKVVHDTGTNSYTTAPVADLTNKWHQLTVKFNASDNTKFDVLLDDTIVASGLKLKNSVNKTLNSLVFSGAGYIDELYVSRGDPQGPYPTNLTALVSSMDTSVSNWLAGVVNNGLSVGSTLTGFNDQTKLNNAYLLNTLNAGDTYHAPTFGIQSFDLIAPATLRVKVKLTSTDGNPKSGTINGVVRLYGKATATGAWVLIGTRTPTFLTDGTVTLDDFTGIDSSYRYFLPKIEVAP